MAGRSERRTKRVTLTFTGTGITDVAVPAYDLGFGGVIYATTWDMEAGGGATAADFKLVTGNYADASSLETVGFSSVPDREVAYNEAGLAPVASGTGASFNANNVAKDFGGAVYSARDNLKYPSSARAYDELETAYGFLSVTAGSGAWTINVTFFVNDVE
jgi:predicted outer membrane repeat protein